MAQLIDIERSEPRPGHICYAIKIGVTVDGNACEWTYNLRYSAEPDQAQLNADIAAQLAECDLYAQAKAATQGDPRAEYVFTDDKGKVRVMLSNGFCRGGCRFEKMADLPLALARSRPQRAKPDLDLLRQQHGLPPKVPRP